MIMPLALFWALYCKISKKFGVVPLEPPMLVYPLHWLLKLANSSSVLPYLPYIYWITQYLTLGEITLRYCHLKVWDGFSLVWCPKISEGIVSLTKLASFLKVSFRFARLYICFFHIYVDHLSVALGFFHFNIFLMEKNCSWGPPT